MRACTGVFFVPLPAFLPPFNLPCVRVLCAISCSPARLPTYLPAGPPARLPVILSACLPVCLQVLAREPTAHLAIALTGDVHISPDLRSLPTPQLTSDDRADVRSLYQRLNGSAVPDSNGFMLSCVGECLRVIASVQGGEVGGERHLNVAGVCWLLFV